MNSSAPRRSDLMSQLEAALAQGRSLKAKADAAEQALQQAHNGSAATLLLRQQFGQQLEAAHADLEAKDAELGALHEELERMRMLLKDMTRYISESTDSRNVLHLYFNWMF